MSQDTPPQENAKPEAPPPQPPGLGELFERSLSSLFLGRPGYARLLERPAPSFGVMTGLALGFAVTALGLNTALTAISQPALLGAYPAWFYAAVAAASLGLCLAFLLLSAAALYGLGKALGGEGGFERAYLAAAMLFALAPLQSLTGLFPYAWLAPSVLFIWSGAGALSGLLRAGFPGALTACAMLSMLAIAGQGAARAAYAKSQEMLAQSRAVLQAGQAAASAAALMQNMPGMQAQMPPQAEGAAAEPGAPAGASGLDLLKGGAEDAGQEPGAPAPTPQQMLAQGDALRLQAEAMIGSILPMLDNPQMTRNLDAQGKADLQELKDMLAKLKSQSASNSINTADYQAMMMKIQSLSMRMMMSSVARPPAGTGAAAPERKR